MKCQATLVYVCALTAPLCRRVFCLVHTSSFAWSNNLSLIGPDKKITSFQPAWLTNLLSSQTHSCLYLSLVDLAGVEPFAKRWRATAPVHS